MNKHFDDSRYYLKRAGEHASLGVRETLEPYATRLRKLVGREADPEPEPEPARLETVVGELTALEQQATGRVRSVAGSARENLSAYHSREPPAEE
ncbi:hypothetical protein GS429_01455 [Natronorubrum sp. JWXQ-INN-674]|uniref:Uncharacterized protein n=1 Tax=Natronorubrum halalkaliphilum TaxID=2691917 RepID=A0A6B0VI33_9EURY|nr:hypothetical protein [Natronorubrum halalkaliphilum]MXV60757.1 hypothetical protein [Natronorubrum halalkaliphilum]